jgi:ribosomal protein S4E
MANSLKLKDGDQCTVVAGTHTGKSGTVKDINTSKTGHVTITVVQKNGVRFKTLEKNVTKTNTSGKGESSTRHNQ